MGSSIEFGVLREGSTIALMGEYRVTTDEGILEELAPVLQRIEARTGEDLDTFGSASFAGRALQELIGELRTVAPATVSAEAAEFVADLLRVAEYAQREAKAISYFGL
jgi:hypothetical protein